jgi:hypothetical protein
MSWARLIHVTRIVVMRIGYSLRHIHDPVLSSLKMKGIRLSFSVHCFPTPPQPALTHVLT